jgi:hypothetical protein
MKIRNADIGKRNCTLSFLNEQHEVPVHLLRFVLSKHEASVKFSSRISLYICESYDRHTIFIGPADAIFVLLLRENGVVCRRNQRK